MTTWHRSYKKHSDIEEQLDKMAYKAPSNTENFGKTPVKSIVLNTSLIELGIKNKYQETI